VVKIISGSNVRQDRKILENAGQVRGRLFVATAGFTLLELIITFTILSLILVMIFGAMRLGSSSWERGEASTDRYQRMRIVFNLLSQQLKSAFPYKVKAQKAEADYIAYRGEGDSLRFVSVFSLQARRPEGLVYVIYRIEEKGSTGKTLKVFEKRVLNKDFMEESPDDDKFLVLLEDLSDFKFEYFQEGENKDEAGEWVESWDGKDKKELPREVRMTVQWKEKKGKKEEIEMSLPALVSIPAHRFDDRVRRPGPPGPRTVPRTVPQ
jgi:general secretion pathway protein J